MSVYGFRGGPEYRAASQQEQLTAAFDRPMSMASTAWDQAKGGVLESFGLGTTIREMTLPPSAPGRWYGDTDQSYADRRKDYKTITEEEYKASPYFRDNVPWDNGMTEDRAAALATMYDAKRVREYFAEKRPFTAFIGNLAGQALDPINYIPVAGPVVKAAAISRLGAIGGRIAVGALDAAANTAAASIATRGIRRQFGDDVSWQTTVSEIATAALIGSAFGGVGGLIARRADVRTAAFKREAEQRLATLRNTQEARIALNEAIDGLANDGEVRLSPNATTAMDRIQQEIIAYHGSPHSFDRFDSSKIGTGEGAQSFGRGIYLAESEAVAKTYQTDLATEIRIDGKLILKNNKVVGSVADKDAEDFLIAHDGDLEKAITVLRGYIEEDKGFLAPDAYGPLMEKLQSLKGRVETVNTGHLYKASVKAQPDDFLDWDKPLSEQSAKVRAALSDMKSEWSGAQIYESSRLVPGDFHDKQAASDALLKRGIAGIRFLDQLSRDAGDGTRNLVIFDDSTISVLERNGQPLDLSASRPDAIPDGRAQAETRIAKPDDYKALADQYGVDPEAGTFPEEAELRQLAQAGRLSDDDMAVLDDADAAFQDGVSYGEALRSVVGCLV